MWHIEGTGMDKVGEQLPSIATTVAGLVLVFLGVISTAWDGYDTTSKNSVRSKFRRRAWSAFLAFLAAIFSAVFGLIGIGTDHAYRHVDLIGVILLAISVLAMIATAFAGMREF